jgi:hypothetical protein
MESEATEHAGTLPPPPPPLSKYAKAKLRKAQARLNSRIKTVSRDESPSKLREFACFDQIHKRLCDGWSLPEVARFVHEDCKEGLDVSQEALIHRLHLYRTHLPPADLAARTMSPNAIEAARKLASGIDEVAEMEKLYLLQMERIGIDLAVEKKFKILRPSMTQEIRTAREILSAVADLKMDLGLHNRHIGTVGIDAHLTAHVEGNHQNSRVAAILTDPEKRRKLLGVASELMKRAGRDVIEAQGEAQVEENSHVSSVSEPVSEAAPAAVLEEEQSA